MSRSSTRTSVRAVVIGAVAVVVATVLPPQAAMAAPANTWTAAFADAGNSSNNAGETVVTPANAARVARAWTTTLRSQTPKAPAVVGTTVYTVVTSADVTRASLLVARSVRTGATLWSLQLPGPDPSFHEGVTVTGQRAVLPYSGRLEPGGVVVVDLATRRVVWHRQLPPSTRTGVPGKVVDEPYADGSRVYVSGSDNVVNAFRLTDGALLWTLPVTNNIQGTPNRIDGIAVANGVLFTGGGEGLVAYDAATGRRLWRAVASGRPVVAGGRLFGVLDREVVAFPAGGCGRATCSPLWRSSGLDQSNSRPVVVSGADATTLFVTYERQVPPPPGGVTGSSVGLVSRLSAATGRIQWTASIGRRVSGLVRAGGMIWMFNDYVTDRGTGAARIVGFSATGTGTAPRRVIPLVGLDGGYPQSLAVGGGTLFHQMWGSSLLEGYRVPGS